MTDFTPTQMFDGLQIKTFLLAGNATVTLVSKATGNRFTFKVQTPKDKDETYTGPSHFVKLLNGPDNTNSYIYLGFVKDGQYVHGRKSAVSSDAPSNKAFAWFFANVVERGRVPEALEVWHEGRCCRCGRKLTVPSSIESGIGPECASKVFECAA